MTFLSNLLLLVLKICGTVALIYIFLSLGATFLLLRPPKARGGYTPKSYGIAYESVNFFNRGGKFKLSGWLLRHDEASNGLLIFCHGLRTSKVDFLPLAAFFYRNNFDCLLFDFRAHGDSEGFLSNLGFAETEDILGAIDYAEASHLAPDGNIVLLGTSMGAAACLFAAEKSPRIRALVCDSPFANGFELIEENFSTHFHGLPRKPFWQTCRFLLMKFGGFTEQMQQPVDAAPRIRVPALFIHGEQDEAIPPWHTKNIFKAYGTADKELWLVPGAGHLEAFDLHPEDYQQRTLRFVEEHVGLAQGKGEVAVSPDGGVEVAAGIIINDGKVLLTRRIKGKHLEGMWEFPGGKLNPGEVPQLAVIREVREEVDLEVIVENLVSKIDYAYPDRNVRIHFFKCRILKGTAKPIACGEIRWASIEELKRISFPPANASVLPRLRQFLS